METEQGTPVVDSKIESPRNIDLFDPRLPRSFRVWTDFKTNHSQQIERIGVLEPEEVISLAGEFSTSINCAIGIGVESTFAHSVSKDKLVQLTELVSSIGNRIIFMRHGEQSSPEWISSLTNPALRKIRMMRDPFNRQDLLTNNGLVDVFVTALALLYVQALTGKRTRIFSSENLRAKEAAYIISTVIPGSGLATLEGLNCVTYKDEIDQPPLTEEDLLVELPLGMMPWNPELVDKLCKRPKSDVSQSEAIISTVSGLIEYGNGKNGNKIAIVLTHTQQLAESLRVAGYMKDPFIRFPELSMIVLRQRGNLIILPKGVISEAADKI